MDLGSLKMTLIVIKFSSFSYRKHVDLCCEYGLGENLAFENLQQFQNLEINDDLFIHLFLLSVVTSISRLVENHTNITHVLHLCETTYWKWVYLL